MTGPFPLPLRGREILASVKLKGGWYKHFFFEKKKQKTFDSLVTLFSNG
jgi:hypothetical protein